MKQNKFFILAAALAFVACSSDDSTLTAEKAHAQQQEVGFDAYVNRGITRAGTAGELNAENIKYDAYTFGVFGYYTDNQLYGPNSTPNFMYNQQVVYATDKWAYTPVKYWPNEFGTGAVSDGEDKLTFFAYAPYVKVTPATGRVASEEETSGIVGLTSNVTAGDPYVKYYVDFDPAKSVDLCWGVSNGAFTSTVTGPTKNNIANGEPFIDVIKPEVPTNGNLKFDFQHALSKLNVQIDADVDVATVSSDHSTALAAKTKIYVRSVTFDGFAQKGLLNLNSKKLQITGSTVDPTTGPQWYELSGTNTKIGSTSVTIYDGRRNGKEGQANADVANEKPSNLNPAIVQKETATNGVTNSAVNLFNGALDAPVYVIPGTDPLTVTIVYDVETEDENVAGYLSDGKTHGSTIENKITKQLFNVALIPGYAYTVKLHLGMTSVQFEATVTAWTVSAQNQDHTLPNNN